LQSRIKLLARGYAPRSLQGVKLSLNFIIEIQMGAEK
jgi:hypothetical protein